jgi:ABC-2 type transport system permease protein
MLGTVLILFTLLVPAAIVGAILTFLASGPHSLELSTGRMILIAAAYLIYFLTFVMLALSISAFAPSSRASLISLLSIWFLFCFVAPRIATDLAKAIYPTPTALEFIAAVEKDKLNLIPWGERVTRVKERLLKQYNTASVESLPINPEGVALSEGEADDTIAHAKHFNHLFDLYEKQNHAYQAGSILSPMIAMQSISMGLAGTDFPHYRHFLDAGEKYRVLFIKMLNDDVVMAKNAWAYTRGKDFWGKIPAFEYTAPGTSWAITHYGISAGFLAFWLLASCVAAVAGFQKSGVE